MNYSKIIEKSWSYIWRYRFLWWLGILAGLTESGFNFSGSNYSVGGDEWRGDLQNFGNIGRQIESWISGHIILIVAVLAIIFLVSLAILYISYSARAGLFFAVNSLEAGEKAINFATSFRAGRKYFWRLLGLTLLVVLIVLAALLVLAGVGIGMFALAATVSLWFLILIIPLALALFLAFIVLSIYLGFALNLGARFLVIKNYTINQAFFAAGGMIRANLGKLLVLWLINMVLAFAAGLVFALIFFLVGGLLVGVGIGIYYLAKISGVIIYSIPVLLIIIAALIAAKGLVCSYFSTYWTLAWREIQNAKIKMPACRQTGKMTV